MPEAGSQVSGVASLTAVQPEFYWLDAEGNPTAERVTECHLYFDRLTEDEKEGFQCDLELYADEGGCLSTPSRTGSAAHLVRGAEYACHYAFEEKDPGSIEDDECQIIVAAGQVYLQRRYRLKIELGDLDELFADGDEGRRQKLQALGFYYEPTDDTSDGREKEGENCLKYWKRLRSEIGALPEDLSDDALDDHLSDHLRRFILRPDPEADPDFDPEADPSLDAPLGESTLAEEGEEDEGEEGPPPIDLTETSFRIHLPGTVCVRDSDWLAGRKPWRFEQEAALHEANPALGRIPIVATLEKHGEDGTWEPEEGTDVYFQLVRPFPDDPVAEQAWWSRLPTESGVAHSRGGVRDFVGVYSCHDFDPKDPQRFNIHADWGGFRGKDGILASDPSDPNVFCGYEVGSFPWTPTDATSEHDHSVKATTDGDGRAGVCLHARFGGDRYRVRAFIDPGEGGESDGTDPGAVVAETGDLTVWKHVLLCRWYRRPTSEDMAHLSSLTGFDQPDIDLVEMARELRHHFIRLEVRPAARSPVEFDRKGYQELIRTARKRVHEDSARPSKVPSDIDIEAFVGDRWNQPYLVLIRDPDHYSAARRSGAKWIWRHSEDPGWWRAASWIVEEMHREILRIITGQWVPGITLVQAMSGSNLSDADYIHTIGTSHGGPPKNKVRMKSPDDWDTPTSSGYQPGEGRGFFLYYGKEAYADRDIMPYDATRNAIHELGHTLMLRHHWTHREEDSRAVGGEHIVPTNHDYADYCVMGYLVTPGHYCGKCHFKLRGADESAMPLNDDKEEWVGLDRPMGTSLTLAPPGEEEGTAPPLEGETAADRGDDGDGGG